MNSSATLLFTSDNFVQSWSTARGETYETHSYPTFSAIIGLVASALGAQREDDAVVERLAKLDFAVRRDRKGVEKTDFQTVDYNQPLFLDEYISHEKPASIAAYKANNGRIHHKSALHDASFRIALSGESSLIEEVREALLRPARPLFWGRKSFPASIIDATIVQQESPKSALLEDSKSPLGQQASECSIEWTVTNQEDVLAFETKEVRDIPVSFNPERRRYLTRLVAEHTFVHALPMG